MHSTPSPFAGLVGDGFPYLLELARRQVLQPDATVLPAGATLYCMGVQAVTEDVCGFDFSDFNKYRCARRLVATRCRTAGGGRHGMIW